MAGGIGGAAYGNNGGAGGDGGASGTVGIAGDPGTNGTGGTAGAAGVITTNAGLGGPGGPGANGGGGGGGGGGADGGTLFNGTALTGGNGGIGGSGSAYGGTGVGYGGGGGGGAGGRGLVVLTVASFDVTAAITGGNGGQGGDGGDGGNGGDGGAGIDATAAPGTAINITAAVNGGDGGAYGTHTLTPSGAYGTQGFGGAGVVGSGLNITLGTAGSVTGGTGSDGQADSIEFTGGANTLALDGGSLSGAIALDTTGTSLLIDPQGTQTLDSAIIGTGSVEVGGGAGGTLILGASEVFTGSVTVDADYTLQIADGRTLQIGDGTSGDGTLSGTVVDYGTLAFDHAAGTTTTFAGNVSGYGELRQIQGTTVLAGIDTISGETEIDGGTLQAGGLRAFSSASQVDFGYGTNEGGGATSGTLDLAGFSQTVGGLSGNTATTPDGTTVVPTGTVTNSGAAPVILTIAAYGGGSRLNEGGIPSNAFSGTIQDGANGGTVALEVEGTLVLDAGSTYTGGTTIELGGDLVLGSENLGGTGGSGGSGGLFPPFNPDLVIGGNGAPLYSIGSVLDPIVDDGTLTFAQYAQDADGNPVAVTVANDVSGGGGVLVDAFNPQEGPGNGEYGIVALTGANTYSGTTQVSAGTLQGGNIDTFSANSTVALGPSGALDLGGYDQAIGGLADLTSIFPIGNSSLDVVENSGPGPNTVTVGADNASTSFAGRIIDGATSGRNIELAALAGTGAVAGQLALDKVGTGKLTLSGFNTFSGGTTLAGGTLDFAIDQAAGNGAAYGNGITFAAGTAGTLELDQRDPSGSTFAQTLTGFGDGDVLDLRGLDYVNGATAAVSNGVLTVSSGGITDDFTLADPTATNFAAVADGHGGTAVLAFGAPVITGTTANQQTTNNVAVDPFTDVSVIDPDGGTDTLTIALSNGGAGGILSGNGLTGGTGGVYKLTGSSAQITQELDALVFSPAAGAPGTSTTTTFTLTDSSTGSNGLTATDGNTTVTNTVSAATVPTNPGAPGNPGTPGNPGAPAPDAVSIDDQVFFKKGTFTLTGTASSASGVKSVEISAQVDGVVTDLGAAAVNQDGTFSFADKVGAHTQGFITATETDGAGGTASGLADYSLTGGLQGTYKAEQDRYTPDGATVLSTDLFESGGSQRAQLFGGDQTYVSSVEQTPSLSSNDIFENDGAPSTTYVFNPGFGFDIVKLFRPDNVDHDTLSLKGSDFNNDIATVLADTFQSSGGSSYIIDPVSQNAIKLEGVKKSELTTYAQQDITFHA